ncbi:MAG: ribonuclease P protein component [Patescibacteria group bacterium]
MLAKISRLNLSKNKNSGRFKGQRILGLRFDIIYKKAPQFKAATVVSKKIAKLAVDRNRMKRLVAASLKNKKDIKAELLFIAKINFAHSTQKEVGVEIEESLKKIHNDKNY